MASVGNNIVTSKLSGKLGDEIVFRTRGNHTYVGVAPSKREKEPTKQQTEHRKHFQEAIIYGKSIMGDINKKAGYEKAVQGNQSAFNVAVADFMQAPHIEEIDLSQFSGRTGDPIRIRAVDDFKVAETSVSLYDAESSVIEEGQAELQPNGIDWIFKVNSTTRDLSGCKIVVRVSDIPGNITTSEKAL